MLKTANKVLSLLVELLDVELKIDVKKLELVNGSCGDVSVLMELKELKELNVLNEVSSDEKLVGVFDAVEATCGVLEDDATLLGDCSREGVNDELLDCVCCPLEVLLAELDGVLDILESAITVVGETEGVEESVFVVLLVVNGVVLPMVDTVGEGVEVGVGDGL